MAGRLEAGALLISISAARACFLSGIGNEPVPLLEGIPRLDLGTARFCFSVSLAIMLSLTLAGALCNTECRPQSVCRATGSRDGGIVYAGSDK